MNLDALASEWLEEMEQLPRSAPQRMVNEFSKGEFFLLNHLLANGGTARPGEMSRAMGASTARVAAAVGSMERKGWVYRTDDESDHRKTLVHLTDEGKRLVAHYRAQALLHIRAVIAQLGEADSVEFIRILRKMKKLNIEIHMEPMQEPQSRKEQHG